MNPKPPKRSFPGLAERAKTARLERGLSQQIAATRAGMSMNRLRDLERYGLATVTTVTKLARMLGVSIDDLTGRREGGAQ
jgi:transcriptional regulator with XRE-family HTH domain